MILARAKFGRTQDCVEVGTRLGYQKMRAKFIDVQPRRNLTDGRYLARSLFVAITSLMVFDSTRATYYKP
jgi:hypothetical protein